MSRLDIQVGQIVDRQQIHDTYGGRTQPRISTVKDADYLFLFIDPVGDERVGLTCGTADDGCLHVAGEGLHGDQKIKGGNLTLANQVNDGKDLHVFSKVSKGRYVYVGMFALASDTPWYRVDMPDFDQTSVRDGIVFRLSPIGRIIDIPSTRLATPSRPELSILAARPAHLVRNDGNSAIEQQMSASFATWMARGGIRLETLTVLPEGEFQPIDVPLHDPQSGAVYCLSPSTSRTAIRTALGEAMDLKRLMETDDVSLLLPSEPRDDVKRLIHFAGFTIGWAVDDDWHFSAASSASPSLDRKRDFTV